MKVVDENYHKIKDDRRSFDIRFWQSQGDHAKLPYYSFYQAIMHENKSGF